MVDIQCIERCLHFIVTPKRFGKHGAYLESISEPYSSSTSSNSVGKGSQVRNQHTRFTEHGNSSSSPVKRVHKLKSQSSSMQSNGSYRDDTHRLLPSASSSSSTRFPKNCHQQTRSRSQREDIILSSDSDSEGSDMNPFRSHSNKHTLHKRLSSSTSNSASRGIIKKLKSTTNEKNPMVIDDNSDFEYPSSPFSLTTPPRIETSASTFSQRTKRSPSIPTLFEQEAPSPKESQQRQQKRHNEHGFSIHDDDFQQDKDQRRESWSSFQSESSRRSSEKIDRLTKAVQMSVDEQMDQLLSKGPKRTLRDAIPPSKYNSIRSSSKSAAAQPTARHHSGNVTLIDSDEEEPALQRRGISVPSLDDEDSGKEEEIHWLQEDDDKKEQDQSNKQKRRSNDDGDYTEETKYVSKKKRSLSRGKLHTASSTRSSRRLAAKQEPLCISIDEDSDDQVMPVQTIYTPSEEEQP